MAVSITSYRRLFITVISIFLLLATGSLLAQANGSAIELTGEASVVIYDDTVNGRSETRYYLIDRARGKETRLFFGSQKAPKQFQTGRKFKVRGLGRPDGLDVQSLTLITDGDQASTGGSEAPLADAETRNVLTILVDFNDATVDGAGMSYGISLQEAKDRMYNQRKSVAGLFFNASLGTLTIPPDPDGDGIQDVFGPYQIDDNYLNEGSAGCTASTWVTKASAAWEAANPGKDISLYRHRLLIVPNYWDYNSGRNCTWGGVAQLGCGSWCWAIGADGDSIFHGVLIHELGHNFGLHHARTDTNNDGTTDSEYGDGSDMMGSSRSWMKFNATHAEDKGWLDPTDFEIRTVLPSASAQNFDLIAMDEEAWDWPGLRALKIERTANTDYYLSYRLSAGNYNNVNSSYRNKLNIHYGYDGSAATYLVATLAAGQTFNEPHNNLIFTATSVVTVTDPDTGASTQVMGVEICQNACSSVPAPSNLTATAFSVSEIDLAWTDNATDAIGFELEHSSDGSSWSLLTDQAGTTYRHGSLAIASTHYYRVRAYNGAENSGWSNTDSSTTLADPPSANFSWTADFTDAIFTDLSTDPDGTVTAWSWDFGDITGSSEQNPAHTYVSAGTFTVSLTVTDNHGATDFTSQTVTVTAPPYTDHGASSELTSGGTVSGSYTDTLVDDGIDESIRERESGGRKSNRYSWLEHKWNINIPSGGMATVRVNAWKTVSADGDDFRMEYSLDGASWTAMFDITATSDSGLLTYLLPLGTGGTVQIRVVDTDHGKGNRSLDTVFVDFLSIRVDAPGTDLPDGDPASLTATAVAFDQIDLAWSDGSTNETGFAVEWRLAGDTAWNDAGTTAADVTTFSHAGLTPSTTYEYRVFAFTFAGDSANPTNIASAMTAPPPPAPDIVLNANGRKVKGKHTIDLDWSGNNGTVNIFLYGGLVSGDESGNTFTHFTSNKGTAEYAYQVCETADPSSCSNEVTVNY